jgi:hypothetical protein
MLLSKKPRKYLKIDTKLVYEFELFAKHHLVLLRGKGQGSGQGLVTMWRICLWYLKGTLHHRKRKEKQNLAYNTSSP